MNASIHTLYLNYVISAQYVIVSAKTIYIVCTTFHFIVFLASQIVTTSTGGAYTVLHVYTVAALPQVDTTVSDLNLQIVSTAVEYRCCIHCCGI